MRTSKNFEADDACLHCGRLLAEHQDSPFERLTPEASKMCGFLKKHFRGAFPPWTPGDTPRAWMPAPLPYPKADPKAEDV